MRLGTAQVLVKADTRRYEQDIVRARGTIKKFGQTSVTYLNKAGASVKSFTSGVFSLKGMLTGLAGAYGLQQISSSFLDTAASFERLNISLDTITKGKGKETFEALNKWAAGMPGNTEKAITSYKNLRAMGLEPTLKDMTILVDTVSSLGGHSDALERVVRALGQMATKGRVSTEELLQLAEWGVPAFQVHDIQMGLTARQLGNIGQAGLDVNEALKALMAGMAERYGGASEKFMASWAGMIESMKSTFLEFRRVVMESGPFTAMKKNLKSFLDYLATNQGQMDLGTWAQQTAVSVLEAFKFMTQSADVFYTVLKDAQSLFAGLIQGVQEIRLPHIEKSIEDIKKQQTGWQSAFYSNRVKLQNAKLLYDLENQRDAIKKSIKYWDGLGTSSQEALRKAEAGFKKIERAIDFLKSKNSSRITFFPGGSLGGKGIGGGSDDKGKEKTKTEMALERQYQAELMNRAAKMKDSWLLYDEGAKRAEDAMLKMQLVSQQSFEQIEKSGETMGETLKNATMDWAGTFSSELNDLFWDSDATFQDIGRSYFKMLSQMLVQKQAIEPLLKFSSDGIEKGFSFLGSLFSSGSGSASVPWISPAGVPHFDTGGMMGSDGQKKGFPAVLHEGEVVGTPDQMSRMFDSKSSVINIYINAVDAGSFDALVKKNPGSIISVVSSAMTGNTTLRQTMRGTI